MRAALFVSLVLLVAGCASPTGNIVGKAVGTEIGDKAPDFSVLGVDGKSIKLSEITPGKPVIIEFVATWCPYCYQDLGNARDSYKTHGSDVAYIVIGLDIDEGRDALVDYRDKYGFPGLFALGNKDVLISYHVDRTTLKYAITKEGVIGWKGSGAMPPETWEKLFIVVKNA